jgi:hypothetical protein
MKKSQRNHRRWGGIQRAAAISLQQSALHETRSHLGSPFGRGRPRDGTSSTYLGAIPDPVDDNVKLQFFTRLEGRLPGDSVRTFNWKK